MDFKREPFTREVFEELLPLFQLHQLEVAPFKDIPLDPNVDQYVAMEDAGIIRLYTARDSTGECVGYSLFTLLHHPHYRTSLQALQDIVFIRKDRRGFGGQFMLWCDKMLEADGCMASFIHVNVNHDFGPMLESIGYSLLEKSYVKRMGASVLQAGRIG